MDWAAWSPSIIAVLPAIFIAGQVSGRINGQEKTLENHEERLDNNDIKLENLGTRMTASEKWTEGYNAGSARH